MPAQVATENIFDVFLSHSGVDEDWAKRLRDALTAEGLSVWLDVDQIRPGDVFVRALEQGLASSKSVAIIVSPESMASGWVNEEYSRALALSERRGFSLPIIPILLRDAELPGFLANRSWVDFRDEARFEEKVEALILGIRKAPDQRRATAGGAKKRRSWAWDAQRLPQAKASIAVQFVLLVLLLASAIFLLLYATTREQIVGAFILFALGAAVVTFGVLQSTGIAKTRSWKLGGAAGGFIIVLAFLLPFASDPTADIRGAIYLDGFPPKTATIYLLESDLRDNRKDLEERDQGAFEFKDARGLGKEVRLRIALPGGLEHITARPFKAGQFLRIDLSVKDLRKPTGSGTPPETETLASACLDRLDQGNRVIYLFDLQNSTMAPAKLNAFLNLLADRLDHGIRNQLLSRQLLDNKLLRVKRCSALPVGAENAAIRVGQQLSATAVLWGYAEQDQSQLRSLITFTSLIQNPISVYQPLPYDADIVRMAEVNRPVESIYLAFSSFVIGQDYLRSNQKMMAQKCLLYAHELSPPSTMLREEIRRILRELGSANAAAGLQPIG